MPAAIVSKQLGGPPLGSAHHTCRPARGAAGRHDQPRAELRAGCAHGGRAVAPGRASDCVRHGRGRGGIRRVRSARPHNGAGAGTPALRRYYGSVFAALLPQRPPFWLVASLPPLILAMETSWYALVAVLFSAGQPRCGSRRGSPAGRGPSRSREAHPLCSADEWLRIHWACRSIGSLTGMRNSVDDVRGWAGCVDERGSSPLP